ncbi:MAG: metallophosphoesterase [Candidatus Cloacimonadota bacterium]|nr:metallophosphoesterase [Candidatus Cloacimonadota bacterium]
MSDLHGHIDRYEKLFNEIRIEKPKIVFLGGDLLPSGFIANRSIDIAHKDFINDFLVNNFKILQSELGQEYPKVFLILGNDDPRVREAAIIQAASSGVWTYIHNRNIKYNQFDIFGYSYVPPTPFLLKDWEKYDVSRFLDVGCVAPTEGYRSFPVSEQEKGYSTIQDDLKKMTAEKDLHNSIFLFHAPPYQTYLDRAALDGKVIDYVPLDVHVGSIAIKRFIEQKQPLITLHGHIHESAFITGKWRQKIGRTFLFSAAHHKHELAIVKFDLTNPSRAERVLI